MTDYRYAKYAKATAWGTSVSGSTSINLTKYTIDNSRSTNLNETMGYQEPLTNSVGKYKVGGSMDGYFVPDEMGALLHMLFGTVSSASASTGAWSHTFTPSPVQIFYSMEFAEDALGRGVDSFMVKKMSLKLSPGADLEYSADWVGRKDVMLAPSSPTFTTTPQPLHHTNTTISIATANTTVKALEYTFECDTNDDEYTVESEYIKIPHRGMFKTTIKCDVQFDSDDELYRFYDGTTSPDLNGPEDDVTPFAVTATINGGTAGTADVYGITITTPKVVWDTSKVTVDKRNRIIQNLVGLVRYDSTYGTQVELTNEVTTYA